MKLLFKNLTFKSFFVSLFMFIIYIILFLTITNIPQFKDILKYSNNANGFVSNFLDYVFIIFSSISTTTYFLSVVYFLLTFFFIYSLVLVFYKNKISFKQLISSKKNIFGNILAILGFGCIACGQTLLYPILITLSTSFFGGLVHYLGNIVLLFGIILFVFGIKTNINTIKNGFVCKF